MLVPPVTELAPAEDCSQPKITPSCRANLAAGCWEGWNGAPGPPELLPPDHPPDPSTQPLDVVDHGSVINSSFLFQRTRRPLNRHGDRPWGPSYQALDGPLEDGIEAVQQVVTNGCMTSEWTSALAVALREPSKAESVRNVLQKYCWTGAQFAMPPDRAALLEDLLKVKNALAPMGRFSIGLRMF